MWLYFACRFLKIAANINIFSKKEVPHIPLLPFLVFFLYLGPLFAIIDASWLVLEKKNFWRQIFTVVCHPILGLKLSPPLSFHQKPYGFTLISSPSESNSPPSPCFVTFSAWALNIMGSWVNTWRLTGAIDQVEKSLQSTVEPVLKVKGVDEANSEIAKQISTGVSHIVKAGLPLQTNVQKIQTDQEATEALTAQRAMWIKAQCGSCCKGGPEVPKYLIYLLVITITF